MNTTATFMETPATAGVLHILDPKTGLTLCGEGNAEMGGLPVSNHIPGQHRVCWDCAENNQSTGLRAALPDYLRLRHLNECVEAAIRIVHANDNLHSGPHMAVEMTLVRVLQYLGAPSAESSNGFDAPKYPDLSDEDLASVES